MDGYEDVVGEAWENGENVEVNLTRCAERLRRWKNETIGVNRVKIADLKRELEYLSSLQSSTDVFEQIDAKHKELVRPWKIEEEYWASRANINWARFGDRNTRFFHLSTIQRRGRNKIVRLKDEDGSWIEEPRDIRNHVTSFFHNLFKAPKEVPDFSIMGDLPNVASSEDNLRLCRPFEDWEIKRAVFQLGPHKSPGPDGFAGLGAD
ncbi:Transposon TX1 uncharacterized 149 kDa protein [Linum perenne]